jgi:F-type H+-transporting ATPase subunit epsilon
MADKIAFEVVTPGRRVLAEDVDEVVLPSREGYMGVLSGHAPLLAMLDAGEVSFRVGSQQQYLSVSGGFAEVLRDAVSIMAATCEKSDEIDAERAERSRARAEAELKGQPSQDQFALAEARLKRALTRIRVHERSRG